jgi:hypothetical protein
MYVLLVIDVVGLNECDFRGSKFDTSEDPPSPTAGGTPPSTSVISPGC